MGAKGIRLALTLMILAVVVPCVMAAQVPASAVSTVEGSLSPLTLDTPIEQIASSPAGKAILNKELPGLTSNIIYSRFKKISLKKLQPMSGGRITDQALARIQMELAELKANSR